MADRVERRKQARIKIRIPVSVLTAKATIKGEVRNITSEGVLMRCEEALEEDQIVRISIKPSHLETIEVKGKVMWSDIYGTDTRATLFGLGFCFIEADVKDRYHLNELIAHLQK